MFLYSTSSLKCLFHNASPLGSGHLNPIESSSRIRSAVICDGLPSSSVYSTMPPLLVPATWNRWSQVAASVLQSFVMVCLHLAVFSHCVAIHYYIMHMPDDIKTTKIMRHELLWHIVTTCGKERIIYIHWNTQHAPYWPKFQVRDASAVHRSIRRALPRILEVAPTFDSTDLHSHSHSPDTSSPPPPPLPDGRSGWAG